MLQIRYFFLLACFVYSIFANTSFIENGKRSELFELLDNEISVFKIEMPDADFEELKKNALYYRSADLSNDELSTIYKLFVERVITEIKNNNFTQAYSNYNMNQILPELKIDRQGYPTINVTEILEDFDFTIYDDIVNLDKQQKIVYFFNTNQNFNINLIFKKLFALEVTDEDGLNCYIQRILYNHQININPFLFILSIIEEINSDIYTRNYKTKNAKLFVTINGKEQLFNKVKFGLSGRYSREYGKPNYSLKIYKGSELYGFRHFKLHADSSDPTFLRTKLVSDIHNRLGLTSISANYINLHINDMNMGLFIVTDTYKSSWIEKVYGEMNTTNLFKCFSSSLQMIDAFGCINSDEDYTEFTEWMEFIEKLNDKEYESNIDEILNVDHFLRETAIEYLLGSWDHITNGRNFFMYKHPNDGKWLYLTHDFDLDFGVPFYVNKPFTKSLKNRDVPLYDTLILKNIETQERFTNIVKNITMEVFNPEILFPRIDELKDFIRNYILLERFCDSNNVCPGYINTLSDKHKYNYFEWEACTEFTSVSYINTIYGLKLWVLTQYRYVCKEYNFDCDPKYMDENYKYSVDTSIDIFSKDKSKNGITDQLGDKKHHNYNDHDENNTNSSQIKRTSINFYFILLSLLFICFTIIIY